MRRAETGQLDEAKVLWKKVVGTQMMAFFEYDMASYYLRHGILAKPSPAIAPKAAAAPAPPSPHVPDGSI